MYDEILHLNEVLYEKSAKEKETISQLEEARDRYEYFEKANRDLEEAVRYCREQHEPTISQLGRELLNRDAEISNLGMDVGSLEGQVQSLLGELNLLKTATINQLASTEDEAKRREELLDH